MKNPITSRKRQGGSVLFWILVIPLIAFFLLFVASTYLREHIFELVPTPGYTPPLEVKLPSGEQTEGIKDDDSPSDPQRSGLSGETDHAAGAEELKPESETEAPEQTVQP